MLGLGPIGTLKGITTGGDARKPGTGKKPAMSAVDFDFSDDDDSDKGAPAERSTTAPPPPRP